MRWLQYIFTYSIFISVCAVALCFQTAILADISPPREVYGFVFFSTLGSYNFYWLISKYSFRKKRSIPDLLNSNKGNALFLVFAMTGMTFFGIRLQQLYLPILIAIILTLIYSIPLWPFEFAGKARKAGILKPVVLALTWTFVSVIFPAFGVLDQKMVLICLIFVTRFFLMMMLCMIFDMRDSNVDQSRAFHSLATDVKPAQLKIIMSFLFIFYLVAGFATRYYMHNKTQVISFAITGLAVWLVYRLSLRRRGYFFYYFLVDGMMCISTLFTWIAGRL